MKILATGKLNFKQPKALNTSILNIFLITEN